MASFNAAFSLRTCSAFFGRNNVDRIEILADVHAQVGPILPFQLLWNLFGAVGRSRICPILASIVKSLPRNLPIVRALAGDSTITNELVRFGGNFLGHVSLGNLGTLFSGNC